MALYGLIGHPLGHSFSRAYFTEKFKKLHCNDRYLNFDLETIDGIRSMLLDHPDLKGFNVTIPYKEAIIPFLDGMDEVATEVGAVNTVKVMANGRLKGFNTDVVGLEEIGIWNPALVLGTGGASKAVQYVMKKHGIPFHLVSRDGSRGDYTYGTLTPDIVRRHKLIVNATPLGTFPKVDECPSIPYEALTPEHLLMDLVYNPEETAFLRRGKQCGAKTVNGLAMLYAQAEASWKIWNE